jgi:hypothetical protein
MVSTPVADIRVRLAKLSSVIQKTAQESATMMKSGRITFQR